MNGDREHRLLLMGIGDHDLYRWLTDQKTYKQQGYMPEQVKIIECPRDAMQGIKTFIPTKEKVRYIQSLLGCGFDTIDFGSLYWYKFWKANTLFHSRIII